MEQYGYEVEARTFYDAIAADYAETFRGVMEAQPMDTAGRRAAPPGDRRKNGGGEPRGRRGW